jgi:hypothetical protein
MAKHLRINLTLGLSVLGRVVAQRLPRQIPQIRQFPDRRRPRRMMAMMGLHLLMNRNHLHLPSSLPPCDQGIMTWMLRNEAVKLTTSLISHPREERTHMHIFNVLASRF